MNDIVAEFKAVFAEGLGRYKSPLVLLILDSSVMPIWMKPCCIPFALWEKIDADLDHLLEQSILDPVMHLPWETPIFTPMKANGDICICGDYKCTINQALQ